MKKTRFNIDIYMKTRLKYIVKYLLVNIALSVILEFKIEFRNNMIETYENITVTL
jgi:hypothetical protein